MKSLFGITLFFLLSFFVKQVFAQPASMLVAEAESGYLLIKENVAEELQPASLTKVMTLYLVFAALEKGWLKWEDKLPVSVHAASQPRTNLNLQTGQTITVKEAVLSLIVHSANDAAVVLAEAMAANEHEFAQMMNQTANLLNMTHTVFKNASGLHEEGQKTTAQDMAILALAIIKHFPQYYPLFATREFSFNGYTYNSHNRVLNEYKGAEGLKTGYISAVGYNIISTARQDNVRLVGVVLGKESSQERDKTMTELLDRGFMKASLQKKAVAKGKINPAFDPLHRQAFLQKINMGLFAARIKRQITQAKAAATLLGQKFPIDNQPSQSFIQTGWAVQVGAFRSKEKAQKLASVASIALGKPSVRATTDEENALFKVKIKGFLNKKYAFDACKTLQEKSFSCFVVPLIEAQGDK